ncbi:substrate-binding protein domain-containing protein [Butyrivibrio sp. ob235]|uniref:substrate-binding domain-containing protein n=1 Tax=Butyrivibrio sp. ob235 TaxID=1761780 RepID=UPI0008D618ED|nr:substrate-binding domain-containing protein [Butyrivibrio sp. ob235]SEL92678.1 substrate-binding protein domain-containing protein [Butyrivibrio sp. ob235]
MNKKLTKVIGLIMAGAMTVMAGCGNSAPAAQGSADNAAPAQEAETTTQPSGKAKKIGVLVADVSGEEALGFRNYYEKYIQENYDVTFDYTDALASAEDEKAAIEKFASKGYDAVISLSSSDRAQQIETCEQYGLYYAIASGVLDDEQYEKYKGYEHFVCQIGPSNATEFEAGKAMGEYYKNQGVKKVALYGAFIPNPMHVFRAAGILTGLGCTYGGANDMGAIVGQIFQDQGIDLSKVSGDVELVAYLQGYGDTTTDELGAAIQKAPEAFLSVGMATTFFAQTLSQENIPFADIDSFTAMNSQSMESGSLKYLAGKYSSSIGPVFALVSNAIDGNLIRNDEGNAVSLNQGYLVATDKATFDEYFVNDNGDSPIYSKETLDSIIGSQVTYQDVKSLVESK